jgi:cell division protein ZapA
LAEHDTTRDTEDGATAVTIFGRTYHLRGGAPPESLKRLADVVDRKMMEVAQATGTADTLRLAILAALNLADDAERSAADGPARASAEDEERVRNLIRMIEDALDESTDRGSERPSGTDDTRNGEN